MQPPKRTDRTGNDATQNNDIGMDPTFTKITETFLRLNNAPKAKKSHATLIRFGATHPAASWDKNVLTVPSLLLVFQLDSQSATPPPRTRTLLDTGPNPAPSATPSMTPTPNTNRLSIPLIAEILHLGRPRVEALREEALRVAPVCSVWIVRKYGAQAAAVARVLKIRHDMLNTKHAGQ